MSASIDTQKIERSKEVDRIIGTAWSAYVGMSVDRLWAWVTDGKPCDKTVSYVAVLLAEYEVKCAALAIAKERIKELEGKVEPDGE